MGIFSQKVHNILLYDAGEFYVKKQDGGRIKICVIFCGKSLKEDLSIDTTFEPCYFAWDSPFKSTKPNRGKWKSLSLLVLEFGVNVNNAAHPFPKVRMVILEKYLCILF